MKREHVSYVTHTHAWQPWGWRCLCGVGAYRVEDGETVARQAAVDHAFDNHGSFEAAIREAWVKA